MKNGKFAKRGVATKVMVMILSLVLVAGLSIGGTLAWLTANTTPVVNTFTVGDVAISLTESPLKDDGTYGDAAEGTKNVYKLIPGEDYKKDPKVTVKAVSEKCYLFVKFEEAGEAAKYIAYTSNLNADNGWTQGDGEKIPANVWYRTVEDTAADQSWDLLAGNTITIKADEVTKDTMVYAKNAKLTYTAYAVQFDNVADAATAWSIANP